jgi:hypothetical protein
MYETWVAEPGEANSRGDRDAGSVERRPTRDLGGFPSPDNRTIALVVDLHSGLVQSDLSVAICFDLIRRSPLAAIKLPLWLLRGMKQRLAVMSEPDPANLRYNSDVLAYIAQARAAGRKVYLASASKGALARKIADHLGMFDGWLASDDGMRRSGGIGVKHLIAAFGDRGFAYAGSAATDPEIWRHATMSIVVGGSSRATRRIAAIGHPLVRLQGRRTAASPS